MKTSVNSTLPFQKLFVYLAQEIPQALTDHFLDQSAPTAETEVKDTVSCIPPSNSNRGFAGHGRRGRASAEPAEGELAEDAAGTTLQEASLAQDQSAPTAETDGGEGYGIPPSSNTRGFAGRGCRGTRTYGMVDGRVNRV
ncbi:hypothetical protein CYMTET_20091 [Cymbomonas tetramitiformis]|uniref:Uncharacterized protein n=1 Tax=Cymbomonas tetramitiformis TaxID=36881 RepID=A0AAE0G584_9CHLO|nr:hypothetical protein CYMTET_20091 [Cymbomonas tetramitiformis]